MIGKSLYPYMLLVLLASVSPVTQAATITLMPINPGTGPGSVATWDLWMDFSDQPTLGGGLDVFYDSSVLTFVGFEFDTDFLVNSDILLSRTGDDLPGEVNGIAFGSLYGISGPYRVGTLWFDVIGHGTSTLTMADNDAPTGPFFDLFGEQIVVDYIVTPLPGAAWLLLTGFVFLFKLGLRSNKLSI